MNILTLRGSSELVVLNCWVSDTKLTKRWSKRSISRAKSSREPARRTDQYTERVVGAPANLRILEIGEFCLFKRNLPDRTTLIFTGHNRETVRGLDCQMFHPGLWWDLRHRLMKGEWDVVMCYPPARPLWDFRTGLSGALRHLFRAIARLRTLGTYVLRGVQIPRLVILDYNDEATIPAAAIPLLDACDLYFKRELPIDFAMAFQGATPRYRTAGHVVADSLFQRSVHKLRPISAAVPEQTARRAVEMSRSKTTDVFFAGSTSHSSVRAFGFEQLQSLKSDGFSVDISQGGLPKDEYLERCAAARLAWSPEGYGWECFRHYEASLSLAVPILNEPDIIRHEPLQDGVHAFYYRPAEDNLCALVRRVLADPSGLEEMALRARAHALQFHTHMRVCEYILEAVRTSGQEVFVSKMN